MKLLRRTFWLEDPCCGGQWVQLVCWFTIIPAHSIICLLARPAQKLIQADQQVIIKQKDAGEKIKHSSRQNRMEEKSSFP